MEAIIRGGLRRFTDQLGQLWCSLADYFIRSGHFEKVDCHRIYIIVPLGIERIVQARDIYEEAVQTVTTVRDFGQVFDAYAQFEESMISAKMETISEMGATDEG